VYIIEPMTQEDVEEVSGVERLCFTNPWPISAYRRELRNTSQSYYIVLRDDPQADDEDQPAVSIETQPRDARRSGRFAFWPLGHRSTKRTPPPIIGFAGMWNLLDEAHVTTIGVRPDYQGRGLGELLFLQLIDESIRRKATWLTLEVRVTNYGAQALYRKYEFSVQGRRPRYYSDNNEDAFVMWSESFRDPEYLKRIETHRRRLHHKLSFVNEPAES
jgi:ribosomal-protein-alanine N-acetyltransferase